MAALTLSNVQKGTVTFTNSTTADSAAFTAIDETKTLVFFTVRGGNANPKNSSVRYSFPDTTHIRFQRDAADASALPVIEFTLVEFSAGISVEHINTQITADGTFTSFTAVSDLATSFIIGGGAYEGGNQYGADDQACVSFNSTSEIQFTTDDQTMSLDCTFQIVDIDDASVEACDWTLAASDPLTYTLSTGVTVANTMIFTSASQLRALHDPNYGIELDSDGLGLTANHQDADSPAAKMVTYVVELPTSVEVQHGSVAFTDDASGTDTVVTDAITAVSDTSNSVVRFDTASSIGGMIAGKYAPSNDNADQSRATGVFNSTTEIEFERTTGTGILTMYWQVAEFGVSGATINSKTLQDLDSCVVEDGSPIQ